MADMTPPAGTTLNPPPSVGERPSVFVRGFVPGLVVGLLVGLPVGAIVPPMLNQPRMSGPVPGTHPRSPRPPGERDRVPGVPEDADPLAPRPPTPEGVVPNPVAPGKDAPRVPGADPRPGEQKPVPPPPPKP